MLERKKIENALISVFDKQQIDLVVKELNELGVTIYATGGTYTFIERLGVEVEKVDALTDYPAILGGRVKTLHPKIFGGILNRRENENDQEQLAEYAIPKIDLVIVDLYPFEDTVASGVAHRDVIEKIDIGGVSLIRAAAKNYEDVVVIPSKKHYGNLLTVLAEQEGKTNLAERKQLAAAAFAITAHYDRAILGYFNPLSANGLDDLNTADPHPLRYGENPHQKGALYGNLDQLLDQLGGKPLSYNNLLDIDAAIHLMVDFRQAAPTFAILKHTNVCGCATRSTIREAYVAALQGDPVSAFGGILIANRPIDLETANEIAALFFEVIIAPSYAPSALELLKQKKNRIVLLQKPVTLPQKHYRTILNGLLLEQEKDNRIETANDLDIKTKTVPSEREVEDLIMANKLVKHTKSNAIALVKRQQLLASGTGQTSRVDALKQAIHKAQAFAFDLEGAVMASDAFFPFPDCVEIAHRAGITAVVQPGGSVKDDLSIRYCDVNGLSMGFTGNRHFRH